MCPGREGTSNSSRLTGNSGEAQEKQQEIPHGIQGALPCWDSKWSFQTLLLTLLTRQGGVPGTLPQGLETAGSAS